MKSPHLFFVQPGFLFALVLVAGIATAEAPPRETSKIVARLPTLRNAKGSVACRLFSSGAGFPRTTAGTVSQRVKLSGPNASCAFDGLKPGSYAIAVHHDENDNRKFDTNFLGIPLEGYGVSNNRTHALSAPRWDESKVRLAPGKDLELTIALRY